MCGVGFVCAILALSAPLALLSVAAVALFAREGVVPAPSLFVELCFAVRVEVEAPGVVGAPTRRRRKARRWRALCSSSGW